MGTDSLPLTDEERAELEQLRAEKAQRLAEEQARKERAELEAFINEKYPDDEIYFINGGQDIYPFIFVAE